MRFAVKQFAGCSLKGVGRRDGTMGRKDWEDGSGPPGHGSGVIWSWVGWE